MAEERLNSRLEWQGAEFLVLAHLLIEKIEAYKPYVNHPAYDLVALNPAKHRLARISVKSRWATNRAGTSRLGVSIAILWSMLRSIAAKGAKGKWSAQPSVRRPFLFSPPRSASKRAAHRARSTSRTFRTQNHFLRTGP
jgi:hypothetical protein